MVEQKEEQDTVGRSRNRRTWVHVRVRSVGVGGVVYAYSAHSCDFFFLAGRVGQFSTLCLVVIICNEYESDPVCCGVISKFLLQRLCTETRQYLVLLTCSCLVLLFRESWSVCHPCSERHTDVTRIGKKNFELKRNFFLKVRNIFPSRRENVKTGPEWLWEWRSVGVGRCCVC